MRASLLALSIASVVCMVGAGNAFSQENAAAEAPASVAAPAKRDISEMPEPMAFVKGKYSEAMALNKSKPSADRDEKIKAFVDALVDYDEMAVRSLGDKWTELDPKKQADFKALFRELLELTYTKKIANKSFELKRPIEWDRVTKTKTSATVSCFVQQKDVETEFEIVLHPGVVSWKVYDIVIDGSSLVKTYQKKYAKQIDEKGIDAIMADMQKEIASLKKQR